MKARWLLLALPALACNRNPENSVSCGLTFIAAAGIVIQSLQDVNRLVATPTPQLPEALPARVVGYGTARAVVAHGTDGLVLGYEGQGFPAQPGFGLMLVDDSSEVVRGVLIYEAEGPTGYPKLGTITGTSSTLPLYGARVHWPSVTAPRCPLFAELPGDTTA
jgi:hypothetical protein